MALEDDVCVEIVAGADPSPRFTIWIVAATILASFPGLNIIEELYIAAKKIDVFHGTWLLCWLGF